MHLDEFRKMLGFIGASFIGERLFAVICKPEHPSSFQLTDYLIYQDIVYHGSENEKNLISFKILDLSGTGRVSYTYYEKFWI